MKWGFLYKLGPFETWDALGVEAVKSRLQEEGLLLPPLVESLLASGKKSFYRRRSGKTLYFEPATAAYVKEPERPGVIVLSSFKTRNRIVRQNPGASLLDIGDGVACLEFHSKMNSIDADIIQMISQAVEEVSRNFEGLVIANDGENFRPAPTWWRFWARPGQGSGMRSIRLFAVFSRQMPGCVTRKSPS